MSQAIRGPDAGAPDRVGMSATRVTLTPAAAGLLLRLTAIHGPLMFHQSGGCCDGSAPMCYPVGEFRVGGSDVRLGELAVDGLPPIGFYMSQSQFGYWKHTHLTVDVVPGRGSGFSVEAPEGVRFLIRSRLLTEAELAELDSWLELRPPRKTWANRHRPARVAGTAPILMWWRLVTQPRRHTEDNRSSRPAQLTN